MVFTIGSDDGARLFVDDKKVISAWIDQPFTTYQMAFQEGRNNPNLRTDPNWDADTRALMSYLRATGVGWSFWAYRPDFYAIGASSSLIDPATGAPKPDLLAALQTGF